MNTIISVFTLIGGVVAVISAIYFALMIGNRTDSLGVRLRNWSAAVILTVVAAASFALAGILHPAQHDTTTTFKVVSTTSSDEVIVNDTMTVAFIEDPTILDKYITPDIKEVIFKVRPAYDLETDLYHQFLSRLEKLAEEHPNMGIRYQTYDESYVSYREVKRLSNLIKINTGFDSRKLADHVMDDVLKNVNNIVLGTSN